MKNKPLKSKNKKADRHSENPGEPEERKKNILNGTAAVIIICAGLFVILMLFDYVCPFRRITGIPCPGCGMSRAYISLLKGDIKQAFIYQPLFPTAPVLIWLAVRYTLKADRKSEIALWILCSLYLAAWAVRLITHTLPM